MRSVAKGLVVVSMVLAAVGISACSDDSGGGGTNNSNGNNANTNDNSNVNDNANTNDSDIGNYAGSGSHGDLVTFTIDRSNSTYEVHNETTNQDESGTYQVLGESLDGIYEVSDGESKFYAVELNDKILAANFPTGNPNNTISFGVSTDATPQMEHVVGDYVIFSISNQQVNGSSFIKEWGLVHLEGDGTFQVKLYATSPGDGSDYPEMAPEVLTTAFPIMEPFRGSIFQSLRSWRFLPLELHLNFFLLSFIFRAENSPIILRL